MSAKKESNKQAEVCAESFIQLAHGHMWFAKDHAKRAKASELMNEKVMHRAVALFHRETSAVLRNEAKRVREKR